MKALSRLKGAVRQQDMKLYANPISMGEGACTGTP
jgi:hypothetical protein